MRITIEEVLSEWIRRFGSTDRGIQAENVQALLSGMHLYPTQAQVGAMLECAKDIERGSHLHHYGPFYNITPQLKRSHGNSRLVNKRLDRNGQEKKKRVQKMFKRNVNGGDVFLGGSCNPTTWRKDEAIPLLESLGITYYNPQVAEWTEDLVAVEHNAKESASVLLYVLDRRTRNVVGIVEVANFAGSKREVVLVTDPYKESEPVAGENITHAEYEELCCGLSTLQDLVARQGISVHRNIKEAVKSTEKILNSSSSSSPRRKTSLKLSNGLSQDITLKNRGDLSHLSDVCLYYLNSTNKSNADLNQISSKAESTDGIKLNLDHLCTAVNDGKIQNGTSDVYRFCCHGVLPVYDLYIGGSCFDNGWKDSLALPLLRESRLKYVFATCGSVKSSRASESELVAMENSKVLLFIITNRTRGLETMALASYFIGCRKNVVLCIQHLPENAVVGDEKLSKVAINDYNRGRTYLADLASRSGVPVFESISDAVNAAISRSRLSPATSR